MVSLDRMQTHQRRITRVKLIQNLHAEDGWCEGLRVVPCDILQASSVLSYPVVSI